MRLGIELRRAGLRSRYPLATEGEIDQALREWLIRNESSLIYNLRQLDFQLIASVEQKAQNRLATSRLEAPGGMIVDLIAATCGIEQEIVERATLVEIPEVGKNPCDSSRKTIEHENLVDDREKATRSGGFD